MRQTILSFFLLSLTAAAPAFGVVHAERNIRGTYEVPVDDPALKDAATFPFRAKGDYPISAAGLKFSLPLELTGQPTQISLKKVASPNADTLNFSGPQGRATCEDHGKEYVCSMKFEALNVDLEAAQAVIQAKFHDPALAQRKFAVTQRFGSEPQGIFRYEIHPQDRDHKKINSK